MVVHVGTLFPRDRAIVIQDGLHGLWSRRSPIRSYCADTCINWMITRGRRVGKGRKEGKFHLTYHKEEIKGVMTIDGPPAIMVSKESMAEGE